MRILVVDDDEPCRSCIRDALSTVVPREKISTAGDGDEAWWLLTDPNDGFDLLILDLSMPRVGGLPLLSRIRQHPRLFDLAVVLCSGTNTRQSVAQALKFGVLSCVVKPFTPSAIVQKVVEVTAHLKARQAGRLQEA